MAGGEGDTGGGADKDGDYIDAAENAMELKAALQILPSRNGPDVAPVMLIVYDRLTVHFIGVNSGLAQTLRSKS
jgi:hypothetical protein